MAKRKVAQAEAEVTETPSFSTVSSNFLEENQKLIIYGLGGLALIFAGWFAYKTLILGPQQKEAVAAMWQAEMQFGRDSFALALDNPGVGFDGFRAIADKYGATKAGNMAKYYAGVCCLQTGNIPEAISFLESFDPEGSLLPAMKYGVLGDCYSENKEFDKALKYYEKAADATNNDVIAGYYLKKLGMLNEYQGNKEAALKAYERYYREFPNPQSNEWRDIEKYIYRAGKQ